MISTITFKFTIGRCDDSTMGMRILYNNEVIADKSNFESTTYQITFQCQLPGTITIDIFGKGPYDTKVDVNGNIIADKYIVLDELTADKITLNYLSLIKLPEFVYEDTKVNTNHWSFNGKVFLNLNYSDSFHWHLTNIKNATDSSSFASRVKKTPFSEVPKF